MLLDTRRFTLVVLALSLRQAPAIALDTAAAHAPAADSASVSPQDALDRLMAGNAAFRRGLVSTNHSSEAWRGGLVDAQHPFAIVLSCSDSRVPPEQVFAQGLGDLFTVRVAGNIAEPATVASVEYAAAHLGPRLLLILGHSQCGAVKAAIANADDTPSIRELVAAIRPAVGGAAQDADLQVAVCANVHRTHVRLLEQSELLRGLVHERRLVVKEATYDLASGEVRLLETPTP